MKKRLLNVCKVCGYTWFPRGHKVSRRCPGCGSTEVGIDWLREAFPIISGVILLVVLYLHLLQYLGI